MSLLKLIKQSFSAGITAGESKARGAIQKHTGLTITPLRDQRDHSDVVDAEFEEAHPDAQQLEADPKRP